MSDPLVTIAIPLYNSASYIGQTIESILSQSYQNLEILVYDDRSPDGSVEIVRSFQDPRIKLSINESNLGPEGNWNKSISEAKGKYIKLVCGDDIIYPDCIAKQVAAFEQNLNNNISLVVSTRKIINANNKVLMTRGLAGASGSYSGSSIIRKLLHKGTNVIGEPAVGLFPADLVKRTKGYRAVVPYTIDVDFWCQLLTLGDLYLIDEPLCAFRISSTSWSSRIGLDQYKQYLDFMRLLRLEHQNFVTNFDYQVGKLSAFAQFLGRVAFFKYLANR